jgi:hypothetical protein
MQAMAVRDGDIPTILEPGTYALMLAGLTSLTLAWPRPRNRMQRQALPWV